MSDDGKEVRRRERGDDVASSLLGSAKGAMDGSAALDEVELPLRLSSKEIETLASLADRIRSTRPVVAASAHPQTGREGTYLRLAETIYRFRRVRDEVFGPATFADARWDILLDLFIASERGRQVSVSSACIGAAVPATTALRHLSALVQEGLVERVAPAGDGRVVHVRLTRDGQTKLRRVLDAWRPDRAQVTG